MNCIIGNNVEIKDKVKLRNLVIKDNEKIEASDSTK